MPERELTRTRHVAMSRDGSPSSPPISIASLDGESKQRRGELRIATRIVAFADLPGPYWELGSPPVRVGLLMSGKVVSRAVQVPLRQQPVQPCREPPVG